MCPHVFPPHWIKVFWYNFFHPPLGLEGKPFGLKRSGEGHLGLGGGEGPPRPPWFLEIATINFTSTLLFDLLFSCRLKDLESLDIFTLSFCFCLIRSFYSSVLLY